QNTTSSVSAAPNSATVQSTMLVAVVRATAYAALSGSRNTTHHFPSAVGTVTTRSALPPGPPGPGRRAMAGRDSRGMSAACGSGRSRSVESGVTMRRPWASTTSSRTPPGRSAAARSLDRRSSANTALRTPTGRATRGARMAMSYSSETAAADGLAPLVEHPLQRGDVELRQALAHCGLRRLECGADHGGRARQRLGFAAALAQIQVQQRGDVGRQVLAARVRLPLDDPAGAA